MDRPELDLGRDSFTELWEEYRFGVKTFQEAYGIRGINVGPLNDKVVPDISSKPDNPKEHAETISNHMDMCKFYSKAEAGFAAISFEIGVMIQTPLAASSSARSVPAPVQYAPGPAIDTNGRGMQQLLTLAGRPNNLLTTAELS
ncbi:hypothetical protein QBC38DRAFT_518369 [Podospora fimiseda]|uniref:Uncharacterized protein n=1 Tax=Podospora fimiseda TaxID=252190 RepID=A0AAN7BG17_9PEZI|nr:hypothetical protein QBC38DRAFT_518369 [Podospora fimiseda]